MSDDDHPPAPERPARPTPSAADPTAIGPPPAGAEVAPDGAVAANPLPDAPKADRP